MTEIYTTRTEIKHCLSSLKKWTRPKRKSSSILFPLARAWVQSEPKGVVLIIAPWNYPSSLLLIPLASALAAGNRVILKPSEFSANTSMVLEKMIGDCFQVDEVCLFQGGPETAQALLQLPFDHIFFTGSSSVGRKVMESASKNLTSLTLELGGKSPTLVHDDCDLLLASEKIVWGKIMNAGQTCLAPDYVLVQKSVKEDFVRHFVAVAEHRFVSERSCHIINQNHFDRLTQLIDEALQMGAVIRHRGIPSEKDGLGMSPILIEIKGKALQSQLMQQEIFGPVLPIIEYDTINEAIQLIQNRPKPLSLYVFTKSKEIFEQVSRRSSSGSLCWNDVISQNGVHDLPFGGVGQSGFGAGHGEYGFQAFSHEKAVFKQGPMSWIYHQFYPPYNQTQIKLFRLFMKLIGI